ncbi:MAG: hypothetical protein ATN35_05775 [Epulopiscium sp. Nele67-Bin004]|nr:MAG: hypothetical protein ATN35_05775 [Epulopiscium sp. Nele67-Bin004]
MCPFVKKNIQSSPHSDLVALVGEEAEAVFLEFAEPFCKKKIIVGCIYRPPKFNINCFSDCFYSTLGKITNEKKNLLYLCDFNIKLLNSKSSQFIDHLNASSFPPSYKWATKNYCHK